VSAALRRDIDADVRPLDTSHFALETYCDEIAATISNFLKRKSRSTERASWSKG
jgi:hypothetical protein